MDTANDLALHWGSRIRARREALGLTVEDLAAKCDRHPASVYRWEAGEVAPELKMQLRLAAVLAAPGRELFPLEVPA